MFPEPAQRGAAAASSVFATPAVEGLRTPSLNQAVEMAAPRGLSAWDYVGMLAGFLLTLAITVVNSRGRIFWEDEMLGWLLLRDPSWHHMLRAWNLGADGGGFSFYLLGRAWFWLFGDSALAFRLFSSTGFGLAFVATWAALRRVYPLWVVAFATFNTLFFSPPLTMHFLEGRFYGLLVMSTAFALWLALVLDEAPDPTPKRLYAAAFLVHALLTTSHVLGIVFSFFVLSATVVLDRLRGRRRLGLYLTVAAAWLLLIPEKTSIVAASAVGKPHFWTMAPTPAVILGGYTGFSHEILLVLVLLLCLSFVVLRGSPGGVRAGLRHSFHQRRAAYVVALCLLLVPVGFLVEGLLGTWLFTDRYLQPVTLGLAYLTAELAFLALGLPLLATARRRWPLLFATASGAAAALFAALTLFWVFHHTAQYTPEAPDFTTELTEHLPHDLPVVVEDAFTFTGLIGREADSGVHYVYLLDWPYTISSAAPRLEVTQYHLMENWKRAGYYSAAIQNQDEFLREHPRFLVVHNGAIHPDPKAPKNEIGNDLTARLQHDPAYEVRRYFTLDRTFHDSVRDAVSLVCRGGCDAALPLAAKPDRCLLSAHGTTCCDSPACRLPEPEAPGHLWPWSRRQAE